ncbi:hydroperoxide isomerase ALOXE3-like isoform X2 [Denticeps clupeoides]|nr:hydroperoxide isomerase ALOXE3-like isoform X2 [Denticeps clupeoides]
MEEFEVTIRTSAMQLAGSFSTLYLSLIGSQGESPAVQVEHHLLTDLAHSLVVRTTEKLGKVLLVRLRLEAFPGFPDLDWHCQQVEVRRCNLHDAEVFPFNKWLRSADGPVELRNGDVRLVNLEKLQQLKDHRSRELQDRQLITRWSSYAAGIPRCVDMSSLKLLGPNLTFTRKGPGTNLSYFQGFADRQESWGSFEELDRLFFHNARNNATALYVRSHWMEDNFFGYQCLNGCNPALVRQIYNIPSNMAVNADLLHPFLPQESSLEEELKSGRVFLLDYEVLEGVSANIINGKQQYLAAPLCLLHVDQEGTLKPIAIQLQQTPGPQNPVFLPSDSKADWLLAKMWVRSSDFQYHQLISHFLRTHLLGEVFCVATLRQLPEVHPLHQLLMTHIRTTMQINIQARASLLAPNGVFDQSIGCGLTGAFAILARGASRLRYSSLCVPDDLRDRGVATLPTCYYAQDAQRVWTILFRFVSGWVDLYYHSDTDVQLDNEVQHWISDIFAEGFQGLTEMELPQSFESKAELSKFITMVIFSCSAQHSAVNFTQLDFNLWMPNCPASMSQPPPQSKGSVREEKELLVYLPDINATCSVLTILALLSQPTASYVPLCQYQEPFFYTGAHRGLVEKVQKELKSLTAMIEERNRIIALPYPYLSPNHIENSVAI